MGAGSFPWLKGHGTENDFVLLPDPDGSVHGDLDPGLVRFLCDRHAGIGADGVLRILAGDNESHDWFMDYRNADGSTGEMCGNGVRVFARYLRDAGLATYEKLRVGTLAGVKEVTFNSDGTSTVDMGEPAFPGPEDIAVEANGRRWPAVHVDMGNPHAVVFVDDLDDPGPLTVRPTWSPEDAYPAGVNIEFVVRRGPDEIAMRVHERGVGETRSCGTGTCAAVAASARSRPATYEVHVPGGTLTVEWREDNHLFMTGPAVVHARGDFDRSWYSGRPA